MKTLINFIESEISRRELTITAFARHCEISKAQMINVLNGKRQPGLSFLNKLAIGTGVPLTTIVKMIYPEDDRGYKPDTLVLAEMYEQLSPEKKKLANKLITSLMED